MAGTWLEPQHLVVLGSGEQESLRAGNAGARFPLLSGAPVGEPIVQYARSS